MEEEPSKQFRTSPILTGFVGIVLIALLGCLLYSVASRAGDQYSQAVFCGLPFVPGFANALMVRREGRFTYRKCVVSTMWSITILCAGILILNWEGIVCILMAAPIVIPVSLLGARAGNGVRRYVVVRQSDGDELVCLENCPRSVLGAVELDDRRGGPPASDGRNETSIRMRRSLNRSRLR